MGSLGKATAARTGTRSTGMGMRMGDEWLIRL